MQNIEVKLDGLTFLAQEVQISALMQSGDLAVTSPLIMHIMPLDPEVTKDLWKLFLETDAEGVPFSTLTCTAVLQGGNLVTLVGKDLTLHHVQLSAVASFSVQSLQMIPHDPDHN